MITKSSIFSTEKVNKFVRCGNLSTIFTTPVYEGNGIAIQGQLKDTPMKSSHNRKITTKRMYKKGPVVLGPFG